MHVRLTYMRTPTDGFCIDENWPISNLPRIGDRVFLPSHHLEIIKENEPSLVKGALGVTRRYDVVGVEHRWDRLDEKPVVQISKMNKPLDKY